MESRAQTELEQQQADRKRRDRAFYIKFVLVCLIFIAVLVKYCRADVLQTSAELTGQRIARSITGRALRIGINPAASDCAAGCTSNLKTSLCTKGVLSPRPGESAPALNSAYLVFPPYAPGDGNVTESGAPRGGVCPDPAAPLATPPIPTGAGTPPAPASPYCDVDSDVLTRRDFIAADAEAYGVQHDAALQAADWCIWLAQETGTTAFEWAACMAAESGYRTAARNRSSGCTGLIQIHPCHRKAMSKLGLDFDYEGDRIEYGAHLYQQSGWRPWAPSKRGRAKHKARLERAWNSKTRE